MPQNIVTKTLNILRYATTLGKITFTEIEVCLYVF
jgi:hypothetical protein